MDHTNQRQSRFTKANAFIALTLYHPEPVSGSSEGVGELKQVQHDTLSDAFVLNHNYFSSVRQEERKRAMTRKRVEIWLPSARPQEITSFNYALL